MKFIARKAKFVFFFSIVTALLISATSCKNTTARMDSPKSKTSGGKTAANGDAMAVPENVSSAEMTALNGSTFRLSDYKGKVVLINMWATWCGFCKKETPELVELSKEFQDQVEFIGLNVDNESLPKVENFVSQYEIPYRIGWTTDDVYNYFLPQGIPSTYIITREGSRIHWAINGAASQERIRTKIEEALNNE